VAPRDTVCLSLRIWSLRTKCAAQLQQVSVAQGMFTLREINWMEQELCNYLDWELTVDDPILSNFEKQVKSTSGIISPHTPTTLFLSSPNRVLGLQAENQHPLRGDIKFCLTHPSFGNDGPSTEGCWNSADPNAPDTPPIFLQHHVIRLFQVASDPYRWTRSKCEDSQHRLTSGVTELPQGRIR